MPEQEKDPAKPLKVYTVQMGRNTTTMQLSEDGVKEYEGLGYTVDPVQTVEEKAEQEKAARAADDKAVGARDKSRGARNK